MELTLTVVPQIPSFHPVTRTFALRKIRRRVPPQAAPVEPVRWNRSDTVWPGDPCASLRSPYTIARWNVPAGSHMARASSGDNGFRIHMIFSLSSCPREQDKLPAAIGRAPGSATTATRNPGRRRGAHVDLGSLPRGELARIMLSNVTPHLQVSDAVGSRSPSDKMKPCQYSLGHSMIIILSLPVVRKDGCT